MLDYQTHGDVAVLQLDDAKANAVGHAFVDAVNEGLDRASAEAKAVVVAGREGVFSAGFDLKELQKGPEAQKALVGRGAEMLLRTFSHPQPVVAACTGHAMAAGALLLLACDTRIGARADFKVGLNETAIDMALPVFGLELAKARMNPRWVTAAVTQAQIFGTKEAIDVGYLDRTVPAGEVVREAIAEATRLAELPGQAYAANKTGVRAGHIEAIRSSLS